MVKILCIVQTMVPSTEISIIRPFTYLEQQQEIVWELVKEDSFKPELLDEVNIVVLHRNCHPNCRAIVNKVKAANIPIIYEIDDNYFEMPESLPIGRYMRNPYVVQTLDHILRSASIVKIGSPELLPLVSKYNQKTVFHPYAVDLTILDNISRRPNNYLTIGYAGTVHHYQDFKFASEAILRLAKEFPKICWDFIGCLPEELQQLSNHAFTPFISNYAAFLQSLFWRNWQIGLCPILDLPHNRCKTDNKFREYSACQIAGVYSKIPPYSSVVNQQETGLLVDNTEKDWYEAIKLLITNEELRIHIADKARKWVEQERSIPVAAKRWLELFQLLLSKNY